MRISDSPVEIIRSGIEQRNLVSGPTYLVFALQEEDPTSPFYGSNLYYFNTPGSVVEVMKEGTLGIGADKPLNTSRITGPEDPEPLNALVLADVRESLQATSESEDSSDAEAESLGVGGVLSE